MAESPLFSFSQAPQRSTRRHERAVACALGIGLGVTILAGCESGEDNGGTENGRRAPVTRTQQAPGSGQQGPEKAELTCTYSVRPAGEASVYTIKTDPSLPAKQLGILTAVTYEGKPREESHNSNGDTVTIPGTPLGAVVYAAYTLDPNETINVTRLSGQASARCDIA